jgi:hypothetical protein
VLHLSQGWSLISNVCIVAIILDRFEAKLTPLSKGMCTLNSKCHPNPMVSFEHKYCRHRDNLTNLISLCGLFKDQDTLLNTRSFYKQIVTVHRILCSLFLQE